MTNWFLLELLFLEDLGSNIQEIISSVNESTILLSRLRQPTTIPSLHLKKTQGTLNMQFLNVVST